ncbi:ankyrin repeat-containing protein ITN1 [Quercus suber]|uniref:Ankyrin repeat-containing protein itn1 n=1 Tax=Quercus suber TaxID=58331 RepID=A0AAW0IFN1_QUESU|nr:ankyrin repeat-containing protein ITN1-like [Quercus suber]
MKWNDKYSREILRLMCKKISPLNVKEQNDVISVAIFRAVKEGFTEFVDEVLIANPHLIWARDQQWVSLFQQAVLYREAEIFRLLHEKPVKNSVMNLKDEFRNNVLHMAGMSTPSTRFKCIQGEVLQMQRELQWFKELEQIVHPKMKEERNNSGLTPRELFTSEHNDMKNKGEDWMKNTATSCTVVAALIVTIMFAAAFTVPGGNDQNTGLPIFLNRKLFKLFIVSDALSLFSSSTSALMFLGILTSRYEEEDFLKSLPRKLIIGLFTLFVSIAAMMTAFSSALFLMLRGQSWTFLPVICFASIPVIIFVFMQFSLLVDMHNSTCGPNILIPKKKSRTTFYNFLSQLVKKK